MAIYRGSGTPTSGENIYSQAELDAAVAAALASETAAAASETAAETAQTAAELAETNAETAETNAATSETNAATSESNASTSETNAATSETNAATSETNAAASYDSFDDRYLGAKASDPTLDNDGDALIAGALYFNTTTDLMRVYTGSAWIDVGSATANITEWTATAGQTAFTGTDDNGLTLSYTAGYLMVFQNGVLLDPDDYTATNGTTMTLDTGAVADDILNLIGFGTFDVANTYTKAEVDANTYTQTQADAAFSSAADLTDYVEGTFTPVLSGSTSGTLNLTGRYTKIGRMVHVSITFAGPITASTLVGNLTITGLPYACKYNSMYPMPQIRGAGTEPNTNARCVIAETGTTVLKLHSNAAFGATAVYPGATESYPATSITQNGATYVHIAQDFTYEVDA